jgi:hypothetical protein
MRVHDVHMCGFVYVHLRSKVSHTSAKYLHCKQAL